MKKLVLSLLVLCFMVSLASAQSLTGKGVKLGLNMATLTGDDAGEPDSKIGLAAGGYVTFDFGMLALQPEILFTQKGAKEDVELAGETMETKAKYNYLEIPVLAKINAGLAGGPATPYFILGPAVSMLLSANAEVDDEDTDIKDDTKSIDFGLVFGAGVDTMMGFSVDARWNMGMTSISDLDDEDLDVKNSVISLMVGYGF